MYSAINARIRYAALVIGRQTCDQLAGKKLVLVQFTPTPRKVWRKGGLAHAALLPRDNGVAVDDDSESDLAPLIIKRRFIQRSIIPLIRSIMSNSFNKYSVVANSPTSTSSSQAPSSALARSVAFLSNSRISSGVCSLSMGTKRGNDGVLNSWCAKNALFLDLTF
jgi:hypothetical protein